MSNDLEQFLIHKATRKGTPIKATFELTPFCNMNCAMCYVRHSMEEIQAEGGLHTVDYWKSLIPEMKDMGILFVGLIGGEPFLYSGLQSLYEELFANGFYISITTNATLLAQGIPDWLAQKQPRYVTVSLYGASDETYKKVTGNPKGFTQTIRGIEHLLAAGIPVKLNYVVVEENKQDLEAIIRIKEKYQLPLLATAYCFPQARRYQKTGYQRFSPRECAEEEWRIKELEKPEQYESMLQYYAAEAFRQDTPKRSEKISCQAGRSTFWITWKGDMVPCGMMNQMTIQNEAGHMKENWEELKKQAGVVKLSSKCATCKKREVCHVCAAAMEAETGSFEGCPDYLCQVVDEMIDISKKKIN